MTRVLGLFTKQPEAGRVKTRLAAATSGEWAARVAAAFLEDLADRLARLSCRRFFVFDPPDAKDYFTTIADNRYQLTPQAPGDLGERLETFVSTQLQEGASAVVVVGTDSPTLPQAFLEAAFRELEQAEVVLGPTTDGGYYLVGCSRLLPIFRRISWSTSQVLTETVARLTDPTWRLALLPPWYDIDTLDDWRMLQGHLAALRRAGVDPEMPRTERLAREVLS